MPTWSKTVLALVLFCISTAPATAQVTPAEGYTPPDDSPAIKVGATIFADYTYQSAPKVTDTDGNTVSPNSFNVGRAYINITGNVSHLLAFRITPDIVRETGGSTGTGSSLSGSLTFRLKYAYAQVNLDDWMWKGTWTRFGMQQTPWVDFEEGVYRYRFQGNVFLDREGYLSSSDVGASFRTAFPDNYGDVHVGFYNGDNYNRADPNDQKALMIRATVRPLPRDRYLRGLRFTGFWDRDAYVKNAERRRGVLAATYEHKYLNAAFQYDDVQDQASTKVVRVDGTGWSIWATPKSAMGLEALLRYDHLEPNDATNAKRNRTIVGVAYWLPHQGTVSSAFMLDYEQVENTHFSPSRPREQRIAVHSLVNF